jgi:hypothetical protein
VTVAQIIVSSLVIGLTGYTVLFILLFPLIVEVFLGSGLGYTLVRALIFSFALWSALEVAFLLSYLIDWDLGKGWAVIAILAAFLPWGVSVSFLRWRRSRSQAKPPNRTISDEQEEEQVP